MNKTVQKILIGCLAAVLAVSLTGLLVQQVNYRRAEQSYSEAGELASLTSSEPEEESKPAEEPSSEITSEPESSEPDSEPAEEPVIDDYAVELMSTDILSLKEINDDVVGWITIPDTPISYPLVQSDTDNNHYLNYAWDGTWNPVGSIFLDYRSDPGLTDFHSIIYGHRMSNETMFNALGFYSDPVFLSEHPSVYILTEFGVRRYDVFAAYEADVKGHSYRLGLKDAEGQQALINYHLAHSEIETDLVPDAAAGDRILTLSTCTDEGGTQTRWIVNFVLAYELPMDQVDAEALPDDLESKVP